jgi:hypothetical protein
MESSTGFKVPTRRSFGRLSPREPMAIIIMMSGLEEEFSIHKSVIINDINV